MRKEPLKAAVANTDGRVTLLWSLASTSSSSCYLGRQERMEQGGDHVHAGQREEEVPVHAVLRHVVLTQDQCDTPRQQQQQSSRQMPLALLP